METLLENKITYAQGDFEKDMADVIELCGTWWEDSKFYKKYNIPYKIEPVLFRMLWLSGYLVYTVGRNSEGKLVSCYVGVKSEYMFNPELMTATEIVWCVHKDFRSLKVLGDLIKEIKILMEKSGIEIWNLNVSNEEIYNVLGVSLERKGYVLMDKVYSYKGEKNG